MSAHRVLSGDNDLSCYACGTTADRPWDQVAEWDDLARDAIDAYACRPGGWDHPPYSGTHTLGYPPGPLTRSAVRAAILGRS